MRVLKCTYLILILLSQNALGQLDSTLQQSNPRIPQIYTFCDVDAEFPGGSYNMQQFFINRLDNMTLQRIDSAPFHTVDVRFIVSDQGYIHSIEVMTEDASLKSQLEYVISCMPRWIPGENFNKTVATKIHFPIKFITGDPTFHY